MSEAPEESAYATPAPAPAKRSAWRYFATRRFLFVSILVHVLFGVLATVWIVQTIQAKRKLTFTAAPPTDNPSKRAMEHGVKMAQKRKTMSAPIQAKRIVSLASNAKIALPPMPEMPPLTTVVNPMKMTGMSPAGLGLGMSGGSGGGGGGGGGGGDGGGDGGGGGPQAFGFRGPGVGFTGTFYDFKQDRNGRPSEMAGGGFQDSGSLAELQAVLASPLEQRANLMEEQKVRQFAAGGFNESTLSNYFKGPETLKATQIFIPTLDSRLGPAQFGLEGKVKGRRWIAIYRASVTPPVSGSYHFLGAADDYIVVRFNGQIVLDGSLPPLPTSFQPLRKFPYPGLSQWVQYIREGSTVNVDAQSHYDMQVMIGEKPGGYTSAFLLIEKDGEQSNGVFPIFKLAKSHMDQGKPEAPPFAEDTPWSIWRAEKKSDSDDSGGFSGF